MEKHGMCLQLHVTVDSGGREAQLRGPCRGAKSDTSETPEDISVHILGMTRPAFFANTHTDRHITELDSDN